MVETATRIPTNSEALPDHSRTGLQNVLGLNNHFSPAVVRREHSPNTLVAMPVHGDPHRIDTIATTLHSLGRQQLGEGKVHVVIADNGIVDGGVEAIREHAKNNGVQISFVPAPPQNPGKDAAYARNRTLEKIVNSAEHNVEFRGPVLLLDSDTAIPDPMGVAKLRETLDSNTDAVGVTGNVRLVPDLTAAYGEGHIPTEDAAIAHELPSLWRDGYVDMAGIVALSSQLAGKTTGFMLDPHVVSDLVKDPSKGIYVRMPHGSGEDMIASTRLTRHGRIYRQPNVEVIDEARPSPEQTAAQQKNWGRDHVLLMQGLAEMDLVTPGIKVLEPVNDSWVEWTVPNSSRYRGLLINPAQLSGIANNPEAMECARKAGLLDEDQLEYGFRVLRTLLTGVDAARGAATDMTTRCELPSPLGHSDFAERFTKPAQIGRLAGNIAGMHDIMDSASITPAGLPEVFLFGMRQSASWNK